MNTGNPSVFQPEGTSGTARAGAQRKPTCGSSGVCTSKTWRNRRGGAPAARSPRGLGSVRVLPHPRQISEIRPDETSTLVSQQASRQAAPWDTVMAPPRADLRCRLFWLQTSGGSEGRLPPSRRWWSGRSRHTGRKGLSRMRKQ